MCKRLLLLYFTILPVLPLNFFHELTTLPFAQRSQSAEPDQTEPLSTQGYTF